MTPSIKSILKNRCAENKDYILDPVTRRAKFLKNNQATLIHGGFSKQIAPELLEAALDTDLAFETGLLKSQLTNLATLGTSIISKLIEGGDELSALHLALACADRTAKLVPQVQKLLESELVNIKIPDIKQDKLKNRILKKFNDKKCSALEVSYQYEINKLGPIPIHIKQSLDIELKEQSAPVEDEIYTREELEQKANEYWIKTKNDDLAKSKRDEAIAIQKAKINAELYSTESNSNIESKTNGKT